MTNHDIVVRKLDSDDLDIFAAFIRWNADDQSQIVPEKTYLVDWLSGDFNHVFVALYNGQVIGGLTAYSLPMYQKNDSELFIYEIGVDENWQQQGIATMLISLCLDYARLNNYLCSYVATEPDNIPANKLYLKTGGQHANVSWYVFEN